MGWFDALFGDDDDNKEPARKHRQGDNRRERDPFGRIPPEPAFEAFRSAWKSGAGLTERSAPIRSESRRRWGARRPTNVPMWPRWKLF